MDRLDPRIIGYIRGRPIHLIGGGSEPAGEEPPGELGDLLGGDDGGGGDDGTEDPPQGEQPPPWWETASAALQTRIQATTTSEIDRRINQLGQRRRQSSAGSGEGAQGAASKSGVDAGDVRDARAVARETIGDAGLRLSQEERELMASYLPGAIRSGLERDPDPDSVGVAVAGQFVGQLKKLRTAYQSRIVAQLEQRGVLDRSKLKPGQAQGGGSGQTRNAGQAWEAGAEKAKELLGHRGLTQQGTADGRR
jgi:hypothetical protein